MSPFPTQEDYQTLYDREYYESTQTGDFSYLEEKRELASCYAATARRFKSMGVVRGLLDVGCGTGDFLLSAREWGISGEGVEPSAYAAQEAQSRGVRVHHGVLSDLREGRNAYEAVHCSHVLEHVPDVHHFLAELRAILLRGAPLYLEVPLQFDGILDSINRMRGQRREYSDFSIHHHYFFTPKAITRLLSAHGFDILSLTTFLPCRRELRRPNLRKLALQSTLWAADRLAKRGDVISVWARLGK